MPRHHRHLHLLLAGVFGLLSPYLNLPGSVSMMMRFLGAMVGTWGFQRQPQIQRAVRLDSLV